MTKQLTAVGTYPGTDPTGILEPGIAHRAGHVQDIIEALHYLCAYKGNGLFGQAFPEDTGSGLSEVYTVSAAYVVVLDYLVMPRKHMTGMTIMYQADGGENGGEMTVKIYDSAEALIDTTVEALVAGSAYGTLEIDMPAGLTRVEVSMKRGGAPSTYAQLWAISGVDRDLTEVELGAIL